MSLSGRKCLRCGWWNTPGKWGKRLRFLRSMWITPGLRMVFYYIDSMEVNCLKGLWDLRAAGRETSRRQQCTGYYAGRSL